MEFVQFLASGADAVIIAIGVLLFKHDKRITKLEHSEFGINGEKKG